MSKLNSVRYFFSKIFVSAFVRAKIVSDFSLSEFNEKGNVLYVMPYQSAIDSMALKRLCKKHQLPDPFNKITINNKAHHALLALDYAHNMASSAAFNHQLQRIATHYIEYLQQNPNDDIKIVPVSIMLGRAPDNKNDKQKKSKVLNSIGKFFKVLLSGRDCHARFSPVISLRALINKAPNNNEQNQIALNLIEQAKNHFAVQRITACGPKSPSRKQKNLQLLKNPAIVEAIEDEAKSKKISLQEAEKNALKILDEITSNYKYKMLRITDFVLNWAWNRLYQGLKITNAKHVREYAEKGHEIIYAPCHRSHMDYLLLSFVLFREGLVPPHIAAGINLNFWPAGQIFRRLGAFFIRRSFRGNKLYTIIFREYLSSLFIDGHSVEYFIEGGRSRTGRLLDPKTGLLMMTVQTMLRGDVRPITIVPVYIGYEHVLEVGTYANELRGAAKKKESLFQTIKAFLKLKKLGFGYVNFGSPITLNDFLDKNVDNWRESIDASGTARPKWLTPTTNHLATNIMQNINGAVAVNAMNLCATSLLAASDNTLTKSQLIHHIHLLLTIFKNTHYSDLVMLPNESAEELFEHASEMNRFEITADDISLTKEQAVLMTYYRNNIAHLSVMPAMMASIIVNYNHINKSKITDIVKLVYPFVKAEYFIKYQINELESFVNNVLQTLEQAGLITQNGDEVSYIDEQLDQLKLLAASAADVISRYVIAFTILHNEQSISRGLLEKQSYQVAKKLSKKHGIDAPEYFDKAVFSTLASTIREHTYFDDKNEQTAINIEHMLSTLKTLITDDLYAHIENIIKKIHSKDQ